jgi:hypothetical protein
MWSNFTGYRLLQKIMMGRNSSFQEVPSHPGIQFVLIKSELLWNWIYRSNSPAIHRIQMRSLSIYFFPFDW